MEKADLIGIMLTSKKLASIHELTAEELNEQKHQKDSGEINMFGNLQASQPLNGSIMNKSNNISLHKHTNKSI